MSRSLHIVLLIAITLFLAACSAEQPAATQAETSSINDHVTFYGVGKVARFQQDMDLTLEDMGPVFFSEIFIAAGGEVTDASVRFPEPSGETRKLEYRYSASDEIGDVMYLSGIAESNEAMEAEFPTGAYEFTFSTPGGDVVNSVVSFAGGNFPTQPLCLLKFMLMKVLLNLFLLKEMKNLKRHIRKEEVSI